MGQVAEEAFDNVGQWLEVGVKWNWNRLGSRPFQHFGMLVRGVVVYDKVELLALRRLAVDTQGNLLTAVVHSAGIQDRVGARAVLMRLFRRFDRLTKVFADGGYTGTLIDWAREMFGYDVEVVKRNELHTFKVLPKRWIVERNFAWRGWSRRLSKDYELRPTSAETMIWISFTHTLLRRT